MFYSIDIFDTALAELNKILGAENKDGVFNYVYPVTTENIAGYLKYANNLSTVLTVAGSGDQLFNCIYYGAREVTLFDVNPITYYLIGLKMAMLTKSRREFIDFFITADASWDVYSPKFFEESMYLSIRDLLSDDVRKFWDTFYQWLHDNNCTPQGSELFRHIKYSRAVLLEANAYLASDEAYKETANRMTSVEIRYIDCTLTDLPNRLSEGIKFNTVLLSNISDYVRGAFGVTDGAASLDAYEVFLEDMRKTHLAFGGQIFFAYIYEATTGPGWTEIDKIADLPKHFKNFQMKTLPSINRECLKDNSLVDCVLIKEKALP